MVWGQVGGNPPHSSYGVGFGGVEFVLGSHGGLVVAVKLLSCAKPYSVGEDFVLRLWDVRLSVSVDLGDS